MALQNITSDVIKRVEDASNRPVLVTPNPSLSSPLLATSKIARGDVPAHLIFYNPAFTDAVDYAICFQCGFIFRAATAPVDRQFDLGGTYRGRKEAERLVTDRLRESKITGLNKETRSNITSQMYDGLIRQLRSVPVGLRVDEWLDREYGDLAPQQRIGVEKQLQDNLGALRPDVKKMAPAKIYRANVTMNAAMAMFWSRRWADPKLVTPYTATGFTEGGERLLAAFESLPADSTYDRDLINAWGQELDLTDWYEFLPVPA